MAGETVEIKPQFNNPQPDDPGPDLYVKPKHWNETRRLLGGTTDGDVVTWQGASPTKAVYRTVVGGSGITVNITGSEIQISQAAGSLAGAGTANRVARWTGASVLGDSAIRDDGNIISVGAALDTTAAVNMGGSFSGSSDAYGLRLAHTLSPAAGGDSYLLNTAAAAQINKAGSGTHDTFATMILRPIVVGAGAAALTNTATLKLLGAPTGGTNNYALWVVSGAIRSNSNITWESTDTVAGASAAVRYIGPGGDAEDLTFNVPTNGVFIWKGANTSRMQLTENGRLGLGTAPGTDAQFTIGGTWTGSGQTELMRANSTLNAVAAANAFGLIFVPTFVEAASGTHGQLTGIYVAPAFTNGAGSTTNVFGINIDTIATGALAPTTAVALRIGTPTGAGTNYILLGADATGSFQISSPGPHAFGGSINAGFQFYLSGSFSGSRAFHVDSTITPGLNANGFGVAINPTLVEHSSGTHAIIAGIYLEPAITAGAASCTEASSIYIAALTAQSGTTVASGLHIEAPTGGTTNYGILSGGSIRFTSAGPHAIGTTLDATRQLQLAGSFTSAGNVEGFRLISSLTPAASSDAFGLVVTPTFVEGTGGAHTSFSTVYIEPTVTAGTSTLGTLYGINMPTVTAQSGTTNAVSARFPLPTGATNNYVFDLPEDNTDPTSGGGAATGRIRILVNGTLRHLAYY